ncbi:MAG TPA: response regulator [Stellaceae bacterium]|nr:response regulator [Stellaceae bacterium]
MRPDKCVLIVEDYPLNMKLFAAMLAAQDYHILQATDGPRGMELVRLRHPDLILMDVQLPGMSGIDISRNLKADDTTRDIPIIVTTAFSLSDEELAASGCDGFLAKPISIPKLLNLVAILMEPRSA